MARMSKSVLMKILIEEYGHTEAELKDKSYSELKLMFDEYEAHQQEFEKLARIEARKKSMAPIPPETEIFVMNNTDGTLVHASDRFGNWIFREYGQQELMPMAEITRINHRNRKVFTHPYLIIKDPEVVKQLRLEDVYEHVFTDPKQLEDFFKWDYQDFVSKLEKMPLGMKEIVASLAYKKYKADELTDLKKIRAIEQICNVYILEEHL